MSTQVQYRRGTQAQNDAFTGALAEITVDTTNGTLRVHNGISAGGSNIATVAYVTSQISSLSANSITNGTSSVAVIASGGNIRANVGGSTITNTYSGGLAVTGLVSATGAVTAGGDLSLIGNIVDTGPMNIITSSNGNITLAPNGTGNVNHSGNIMPLVNAVANIGTTTLGYNTIFAKATSAQYSDLAEMYQADSEYTPGTVLDFDGSNEVTITTKSHSTQVAGIVSTNPSYLMNSTLNCANAVQLALVGRVPCHVVGTITKGDRLVSSSVPGVATRLDMSQYQPGCIIGKALEAYNSETVGTIEVAVGRF
jgi:hypothetical protein